MIRKPAKNRDACRRQPTVPDRDSVDPEAMERERNVLKEQAIASGKPAEIAEKMAKAVRKYYEEVCLVEQTFVVDGESKIVDVAGSDVIKAFVRRSLAKASKKKKKTSCRSGCVANG